MAQLPQVYDPTLRWVPTQPARTQSKALTTAAAMACLLVGAVFVHQTNAGSATELLTKPTMRTQVTPVARAMPTTQAGPMMNDMLPASTPSAMDAEAVVPGAGAQASSSPMVAGVAFMLAGLSGLWASRHIAMAAKSGAKVPPTPEPTDDGLLLGIGGTVANVVMAVSLAKLFNTGCGLPPGPFGLYGLAEGLSYLAVPGLVGYSLYTKVKTGSGLPAGKFGLVGLAEGLSFLTVLVGAVVLANQVFNFGFIPNAIPVEGGICS